MTSLAFTPPSRLCGYPADTPVLLALSGGADSRLLLHLCADDAKQNGAKLHLAHVHHGIRGEEADRDEAFCRALAERYDCPIHVLHADVPAIARESGETLETAARRVRYDYFAALMREHRIPVLLTAHHATDNLETVLFRLCRGTGLAGLGGIAPVRPFDAAAGAHPSLAPVLVRPLLGATRGDVLAACDEMALDFVTDSTNADTAYTRNRLRAEVVPALARVVEHPERQLTRLCATLREDEAALHELAVRLLTQATRGDALCRQTLFEAHAALAKRALAIWLTARTGRCPEAAHLEAVLALCRPDATSHACDVGDHTVRATRTELYSEPATDVCVCPAPDLAVTLTEGECDYHTDTLTVHACLYRSCDGPSEPSSKVQTNVYDPRLRDTLTFDTLIPYDAANPAVLRFRREGDRFAFRGVHRKLRKLQNELAISPHLRPYLPLVCQDDDILWAGGIGARDGLAPPTHRLTLTVYLHYHIKTKEVYHD